MEGERDSTQDWLLPPGARPPSVRELELKVDEALAIARSSEAAVCLVGDAALEAAKRAGRAAELAERASAAALAANREAIERRVAARAGAAAPPANGGAGTADGAAHGGNGAPTPRRHQPGQIASLPRQDCFERFSARADRVSARFRALQHA